MLLKFFKKNADIFLSVVLGLFVATMAFMMITNGGMGIDYATAATSANVVVTALVGQSASLTVAGLAVGQSVNGATTNVSTTDTTVPLGTLSVTANSIGGQLLTITSNATSGYTVNAKYDHALRRTSSTTDDINDLTYTNASPDSFTAAGIEAFGYTTEDDVLGTGTVGRFDGGKWAKFETSDYEVAYHDEPANATTTRIGFQAGISNLTAPGSDYQCTVTYTMIVTF